MRLLEDEPNLYEQGLDLCAHSFLYVESNMLASVVQLVRIWFIMRVVMSSIPA